jgi:large subunit ribosomal protein L21
MYAVVSSGGKQYRLKSGDVVEVERLAGDVGDEVVFDQVLFLEDGEAPVVGSPTVPSARVVGTILEQGKGDKVIVFKFKRRKMQRKKTGHRQLMTRVRINEISTSVGASNKAAKSHPEEGEPKKPARKTATRKSQAEAEQAEE